MKRLAIAAAAALVTHGVLFFVELPWARTTGLRSQSRPVTMRLATFRKPVEKERLPKPAPAPVPAAPRNFPLPKQKVKPAPTPKLTEPSLPTVKPDAEPPPPPAVQQTSPEPTPADESMQTAMVTPPEDESFDGGDQQESAFQVPVPLHDLNPKIIYPRVARRRGYEGTVLLDVLVNRDGLVQEVRVAQSSGYAILDRRAAKTLKKKWRFQQARKAGVAIEMWVKVPVTFELQ